MGSDSRFPIPDSRFPKIHNIPHLLVSHRPALIRDHIIVQLKKQQIV
ncbi:MAG: hypothetical protein F6J90_13470 [Moorea sp. SIOASIH]|nr:hypothetical protein [Moorena sp. SIOASIH]NEO37276.1 hypothetical protein [Moorena sp. SIOASIH]